MDETTQFRSSAREWAAGGSGASAAAAATQKLVTRLGVRRVVLVEGVSDQVAVDTLAASRGLDLQAAGTVALAIGGATSIGRFLQVFGPSGLGLDLAGLCDTGEERFFRRALERVGLGSDLNRAGLEQRGFFVCDADLEDELIRTMGVAAVEQVIEKEGDLRSLRILQQQPAQRSWTAEQQLHRFMGSIGGRKVRYARSLVMSLGTARVPRPLELLLERLGHT